MPARPGVIHAPSDLDKKHQGIFRDTLKIIRERSTPRFQKVTDLPLLEQYVRYLYIAAEALARIHEREKFYAKWQQDRADGVALESGEDRYPPPRGWTAFGAQKQTIQHPDVKTWRDGLHDANEVAKELLLPPRTRKQNEIDAGATGGGKFGL